MDFTLLLLRILVGISLIVLPLFGSFNNGLAIWAKLYEDLQYLEIGYVSPWIFISAFLQFIITLLVVLGVYFRAASAYLIVSILFTIYSQIVLSPEGSSVKVNIIISLIIQLALFILFFAVGPGKYRLLFRKK